MLARFAGLDDQELALLSDLARRAREGLSERGAGKRRTAPAVAAAAALGAAPVTAAALTPRRRTPAT